MKHSKPSSKKAESLKPYIAPLVDKGPKKLDPGLQEFSDRLAASVVKGLRSLK